MGTSACPVAWACTKKVKWPRLPRCAKLAAQQSEWAKGVQKNGR